MTVLSQLLCSVGRVCWTRCTFFLQWQWWRLSGQIAAFQHCHHRAERRNIHERTCSIRLSPDSVINGPCAPSERVREIEREGEEWKSPEHTEGAIMHHQHWSVEGLKVRFDHCILCHLLAASTPTLLFCWKSIVPFFNRNDYHLAWARKLEEDYLHIYWIVLSHVILYCNACNVSVDMKCIIWPKVCRHLTMTIRCAYGRFHSRVYPPFAVIITTINVGWFSTRI